MPDKTVRFEKFAETAVKFKTMSKICDVSIYCARFYLFNFKVFPPCFYSIFDYLK